MRENARIWLLLVLLLLNLSCFVSQFAQRLLQMEFDIITIPLICDVRRVTNKFYISRLSTLCPRKTDAHNRFPKSRICQKFEILITANNIPIATHRPTESLFLSLALLCTVMWMKQQGIHSYRIRFYSAQPGRYRGKHTSRPTNIMNLCFKLGNICSKLSRYPRVWRILRNSLCSAWLCNDERIY